jgi:uncharacterized protein (DUF433 family)
MFFMVDWRSCITKDPLVLGGKPVFAGTRIPVDLVLHKLADGVDVDVILEDYPELTEESVRACLAYAADLASDTGLLVLAPRP